nr:transposase [Streptomyces sp. OV198]
MRGYDLLRTRTLGRENRPIIPLGQAFAEYGRIARTEHLLRVVDPVDDGSAKFVGAGLGQRSTWPFETRSSRPAPRLGQPGLTASVAK